MSIYINQFFKNLVFYKGDVKNNHHIYTSQVSTSFASSNRTCIILFVPISFSNPKTAYIDMLNWSCIITKIYKPNEKLNIPTVQWKPEQLPIIRLKIIDRTQTHTIFNTTLENKNYEILLFHDPKNPSKYQWKDNISLMSALLSFKCVMNVNNRVDILKNNTLSNDEDQDVILI